MNYFDVLLAKKLEDTRDPVVKGLSVTENGRYSEENTVYDVVVVDVPEARLTTLNATANGTYTPQEGEAYNEVNVDVPLPSNAYLLKSLTGLPQDIATFTDGADAPLNALTASIELSCAGADIIVSESEIINNKTPYLFRKSAGGDRVYEKLIGGTVAWNQLVQNGNFADTSNWINTSGSTLTIANNEAVCVTTANDMGLMQPFSNSSPVYKSGHIYIVVADIKCTSSSVTIRLTDNVNFTYNNNVSVTSSYQKKAIIKAVTSTNVSTGSQQILFLINNATGTLSIKNAICIDLTQMFGSTIADYIYSLEQTTAGAGVAWFRTLFPNDYYAYDSGSLQSVNVASKRITRKNQINIADKTLTSSGYVFFLNNLNIVSGTYTFSYKSTYTGQTSFAAAYEDGTDAVNSSPINNKLTFTATKKIVGIRFYGGTGTYSEMQLEFGSTATPYEPYEEHTYAFDSDLTLRGIPKLDANNNLYYDGDVYESNGTVTRKYGIVDLGTLDYERDTSYDNPFFYAIIDGIGRVSPLKPKINIFCSEKYLVVDSTSMNSFGASADNNTICKEIGVARKKILIRDDSYTDAQAFKTAMSGIYLVYELATPTTESADAYTNPQMVDADGTEEFVDYAQSQGTRDVAVPVGHDSYYYDGTLYSRDFPATISSGSYDIINGVITSGQNTYNTTPLPLRSLVGNNNIYVDCGEITNLEYFTKEQHE